MYCDTCTNLKRDLRGLRARVDQELTRSVTTAARGGFNPFFAVLRDYRAQRANYEQHRIEVEAGRMHAHV
jgi:hypothetical protein